MRCPTVLELLLGSGAALLLWVQPAPLAAQAQWPVTVEAYLGATRGHSDNAQQYRGSHSGLLLEVLSGVRLHPDQRAGAFLALRAGLHAVNYTTTDDCMLAPDGGCVPWFPGFWTLSALGGWESRTTNLRFLGGPALASSYEEGWSGGLIARIDAALPLRGRFSAVASMSSFLVPSYNDDLFHYTALALGLRIR